MGLTRTKGVTKVPAEKPPMPPLPPLVPRPKETNRGFFKRVFDWIRRKKPGVIPPMPPLPPTHTQEQTQNIVNNINWKDKDKQTV